ncbi:hypothetical protein DOY81_011031, partial [Sarcophaga bullata]
CFLAVLKSLPPTFMVSAGNLNMLKYAFIEQNMLIDSDTKIGK